MKNFYLLSFFLFLFSCSSFAQNGNLQCPLISVVAPSSAVRPDEVMFFSASIEGKVKNDLKYKWKVDVGTIIAGQETTTIQVSTEGLSSTVVTATFEIEGLPKDCNNKDSDAAVVGQRFEIEPLDRYGKISWEDESGRFDSFLVSIQENPEFKGYVWISTDKNESLITVKNHVRRLIKHIKFRKISPGRIIFAIEKSEYHQTTLLNIPEGAEIPKCEDCEIIRGSDLR